MDRMAASRPRRGAKKQAKEREDHIVLARLRGKFFMRWRDTFRVWKRMALPAWRAEEQERPATRIHFDTSCDPHDGRGEVGV